MTAEPYKRKLTAIFCADAVEYSRLMESDEAATLESLTEHKTIIADLVTQHRGRVVDAPGDNLLAEFASAVDAVNCAVKIQNEIRKQNEHLPGDQQMRFRIGINLDDVIEKEERLYGDGVNIAARIEALAPAGGICISGSIFDQVAHRLPFGYDYLGEQAVKNIAKPVRVYRLLETPQTTRSYRKRRRTRKIGYSALLILMGCAALYYLWAVNPSAERKNDPVMAEPANQPPKVVPALAVLPLENLSHDENLGLFADGMTDDIITNLSQISGLSVIARNSILPYKGKPAKPQLLAEELGVQYVLEGSVRGAGDYILVNAQLIQANSGHHVWAERYDVNIKDVFSMQVDITIKIVSALDIVLSDEDRSQLQAKGEDYLNAFLKRMESGQKDQDPVAEERRADLVFWESIKDSGNPEMFKEYLRQFPEGIFAGLAKLNVKKSTDQKIRRSTPAKKSVPKTGSTHTALSTKPAVNQNESPSSSVKPIKKDPAQYEETFWRSIAQSDNAEEYKEFIRKFPDGTFSGLAKIKIDFLEKQDAEKKASLEKKYFSLAVCTGQSELIGGNLGLFVTLEKLDEDNRSRNESSISRGLKDALTRHKTFVPQYSYYPLGGGFLLKTDINSSELYLGDINTWIKKGFYRKHPAVDQICDLGKRLGVESVLVVRLYYIYPPSMVVDLFLINVAEKKMVSEIVSVSTGYCIRAQEIKDAAVKLFSLYEKS